MSSSKNFVREQMTWTPKATRGVRPAAQQITFWYWLCHVPSQTKGSSLLPLDVLYGVRGR